MNEARQYILTRTVNLGHEQLLLLGDEFGARTRVIYHGTWLTTERDLRDHLPRKGDNVFAGAPGQSVIDSIRSGIAEWLDVLRGVEAKRAIAALRGRPAGEVAVN